MARDSRQALALQIDQNGSGQAVDDPSFVGGWTVTRIGAKFDPQKIFLDSIVVVNESLGHQAHELLELDLIFGLRLLQLLQWPGIFHQPANARIILLPLGGVKRRTIDRQQTVKWTVVCLYLHLGQGLLPRPLLDHADPFPQLLSVRQLISDDCTDELACGRHVTSVWILAGNGNYPCGAGVGDTCWACGLAWVRLASTAASGDSVRRISGQCMDRLNQDEAAGGQREQVDELPGFFYSKTNRIFCTKILHDQPASRPVRCFDLNVILKQRTKPEQLHREIQPGFRLLARAQPERETLANLYS
jgi:hypothetical protein